MLLFRPCIDIHDGAVKQIVGATLRDEDEEETEGTKTETLRTNFESEKPSSYYAKLYEGDNLKGGHVIMLGSNEKNKRAALAALRSFPGGMQIGGGIDPTNAKVYLDAGASHVIVTSFVFRKGHIDFDRLEALEKCVGKRRLVLDLSCRRRKGDKDGMYYVVTDRWQKYTDFNVSKKNLERLAVYCDEFLVHGVDVEGTKTGIDEDLVRLLGKLSPIPVTYAGGARSLEDLNRVKTLGKGRVALTIGSALDIFGGDVKYENAVKWAKAQMPS